MVNRLDDYDDEIGGGESAHDGVADIGQIKNLVEEFIGKYIQINTAINKIEALLTEVQTPTPLLSQSSINKFIAFIMLIICDDTPKSEALIRAEVLANMKKRSSTN